jgi:hypothetical protein
MAYLRTALATILLAGCVADDGGDANCDTGKCDQPSGNGSVVGTANNNLVMYSGYHSLFDKSASQCVKTDKEIAQGAQISVGAVAETFELAFVSTREDLAREMGLDLGVKVKYPATNTDIGLNLTNKFKSTSTTINLLLKVNQEYTVTNRHPMLLTDSGKTKLASGIDKFVQTCGTHYVNGVRYGAHMFVLITYDAQDEQTALDVQSSLGVSHGAGPLQVSADVKARLSQAASKSGVSTTVRVASQGFELSGKAADSTLVTDFIGSGVTAQSFSKIDDIRQSMKTSLANDKCRDTGEGKCGDVASPGYFNNTRRAARPTGVEVGFYDSLPNVDFSGENPFKKVRERLLLVERFVRDWGELEERMAAVYWNEIEPFQQASSSQKARFQIAPPGARVRSPNELAPIAQKWADKFFPEIGSAIGFTYEKASNTIRDCWNAASVDLFAKCTANDGPATGTTEWKSVLGEIEQYGKTGRIARLNYRESTVEAKEDAVAACEALNAAGISYRLPTQDEARLLSPAIGFGPINWSGAQPNDIWISHPNPTQMCNAGMNPFFRNNPGASSDGFFCTAADGVVLEGINLKVICVPSGGPLPLDEAP